MNAQDCLNILREVKDVAFATVDAQGNPRVRIIDVMLVEDERLYFVTARGKDFYRELVSSGRVAITGLNQKWQSVRLQGRAEKLPEQKAWVDRIFEENPSMNGVYPGDSRTILEPFVVAEGELEFFDLGTEPIHREYFTIGGATPKKTGYAIGEQCIQCSTCKAACPQQCIREGAPYVIVQQNCLHCGLCAEVCPVSAVCHARCDAGV